MVDPSNISVLVVGVKLPMETFLYRMFKGLDSRGVRLTIASRNGRDSLEEELPNASYLHLGPERDLALRRSDAWLALPQRDSFPSTLQRWDVAYFPWNNAAVHATKAFRYARASIVSCRGSQVHVAPHNPRRKSFVDRMKETLRQATRIHCVSEATRRQVCSLGIDGSKCSIIRPAVDPSFFAPSSRRCSDAGIRVLMVGGLSWVKGYEYALTAISTLVRDGVSVSLEIIGEGADWQRLQFAIMDLGLSGRVVLAGKQPPEAIRTKLAESDVLMLTSVSEGISNAVLEGMSSGLPVVTTDCGGMREAVTNGEEGLVVPVRDPKALAEALGWMANHPHERLLMGDRGRARILRDFSLDAQLERWLDLITETLDRSREGK